MELPNKINQFKPSKGTEVKIVNPDGKGIEKEEVKVNFKVSIGKII